MEAPHLPAPNCQMCFQGVRAGPGGAAAFLFSQPRASCGFAAVFSPSGSGGRPIRFFGRRSIRFFVSAACSSSRLPASSCRAAVATRPIGYGRHVISWFGATPCRRATKLPSCPCPVGSGANASACGHCPPWRRRQSDQQTIAVYRGAASEHSPSARFASSARPGDRFKVRARSSALLHSAYCLSWRCTSP